MPNRRHALLLALLCGVAGAEDMEQKLALCVTCHGPAGATPIQPDYPILAGQHFYYTYVQLKDYKESRRAHELMAPIAVSLEKEEMQAAAQYFSEQNWPRIGYQASEQDQRIGLRIISAGQCVACHLGGFEGNSRVPRLAGQYPGYLERTLLEFKYGQRNNSPAKSSLLKSFSDAEIGSVARHLGGL